MFNIFKMSEKDKLVLVARAKTIHGALRHTRHLAQRSDGWVKQLTTNGVETVTLPQSSNYIDKDRIVYGQIGTFFMCHEATPLRITITENENDNY